MDPGTETRIGTPAVQERVPFGVRWRFAAGMSVPPAYRDWAIAEVQRDVWPVRWAFSMWWAVFLPIQLTITALVQGASLLGGRGISSNLLPSLEGMMAWLVVGAWFGAYRGERLRRSWLARLTRTDLH